MMISNISSEISNIREVMNNQQTNQENQETEPKQKLCKALNINNMKLKKCKNTPEDNCNYCSEHKNKHRLEKEDCSICLEKVNGKKETPLECGHWLHKECLKQTNVHKCALCNQKLTDQEILYIYGENHVEQNNYDDGRSIYTNYEELDHNAYAEFGHGEFEEHNEINESENNEHEQNDSDDDSSDSTFIMSERTMNMLFNNEDLNTTLFDDLGQNGWMEILQDLCINKTNSVLFTRYSQLIVPFSQEFMEHSLTFINRYCESRSASELYEEMLNTRYEMMLSIHYNISTSQHNLFDLKSVIIGVINSMLFNRIFNN